MKCKKCGAELSDDAEFCPVCRSSVGGTEQEAVSCAAPPAPTPEPENIPPADPAAYSAGAAEPVIAPVKKPRKMSLAVSAVLSVVFGMLTMFVCQTAAVLGGAYLRFLEPSRHPLDLGAALCCASAHKTLPVLTGGAYLHISRAAPASLQENAKTAMATPACCR